jgi:5-methylcytosine-specific restriction endonuclease McrA
MVDGLAPRCARCTRRHLPGLPCWGGRYSRRLVALTLATYGDTCWLCLVPGAATTADHRQPRSLGGTDDLGNLAPACLRCNQRRGNGRGPVRFIASSRW